MILRHSKPDPTRNSNPWSERLAGGLDDFAVWLAKTKRVGNEVTQLVIATHGSASSFQISRAGPDVKRVGYGDDHEPGEFVAAIDDHINSDATIVFLSCALAKHGTRVQFMTDLSKHKGNAFSRPVYACTDSVYFKSDGTVTTDGSIIHLPAGGQRPRLLTLNTHRGTPLTVPVPSYV